MFKDYNINQIVFEANANKFTFVWKKSIEKYHQTTNRIYVPRPSFATVPGTVSIIDGTTNTVMATLTVGTNPTVAAVNELTNTI